MAEEEIKNTTGTELKILKNIEKAYFTNNKTAIRRNTDKSLSWFRQYVPRAYNTARVPLLLKDSSMYESSISAGNMYLFNYDAKHKDILPVWDAYPIIFPWESWTAKNGAKLFIGINMHYLAPKLRYEAFKLLLTILLISSMIPSIHKVS